MEKRQIVKPIAEPSIRHDLDPPRPHFGEGGVVRIRGWCMTGGGSPAPDVRCVTEKRTLKATRRFPRPDAARETDTSAHGVDSGFEIEGTHPEGVYWARLEARLPGHDWTPLRSFTLAVGRHPLHAVIEHPPSPMKTSRRVEGWILHPDFPVKQADLHYGHRRIACDIGLPRTDVPELFPESPHADRTGFIAEKNLPAGHGPLRIRAILDNGAVRYARPAYNVSIAVDESGSEPVDLTGTPVSLGPARRDISIIKDVDSANPRTILFLLYGDFASNSAFQAAALGNELARRGHRIFIAAPDNLETAAVHADRRFEALTFEEAETRFADGGGPDILHAWTTRENVRRLATSLRKRTGATLVVHLEDNEREILAQFLGRSVEELEALPEGRLDELVPPDFSHPHRSSQFLESADGVTLIIDRLSEFAPPKIPHHVIWPAADRRFFFPRPRPDAFRTTLGISPDTTVLFYHGNVHASNAREMRELYLAVRRLDQKGVPALLIRAGLDSVDCLGKLKNQIARLVLPIGHIPNHRYLAPLMALADVFVQPGVADPFNDFRFPSKLPEFFASGRPVVLPRTNLGTKVRHKVDAYVVDRADEDGIAEAIVTLRNDPALAESLGKNAVAFAEKHFDWTRSAAKLDDFYRNLAKNPRNP